MTKKFHRSTQNKLIAGVCGGLANYLDWEADKLRIAYVLISLLSAAFPGLLVYLILWFVIPEDNSQTG
ncbi:PspC domain-containing protein [Cyclobacterium salsum]|uniref:PspC domain-containing protein n=1 Tax=Cyclobacterium salsum TaxID=2666329 RepID=UPI00139109F1|nr:PspC domain-containing protein [Cyclobacterium salsum]